MILINYVLFFVVCLIILWLYYYIMVIDITNVSVPDFILVGSFLFVAMLLVIFLLYHFIFFLPPYVVIYASGMTFIGVCVLYTFYNIIQYNENSELHVVKLCNQLGLEDLGKKLNFKK